MSELRPVNLHFFNNETFAKFTKVCNQQDVNFDVRRENDEWYITTEALTPTSRRNLITKWADASIERING